MSWSNGLAEWTEGQTAFISVVFSWRLPEAYSRAIFYRDQDYIVRIGGPAVWANHKYAKILSEVAQIGGDTDALIHHNPLATIASRGCPVGCWFCVVPKMEGKAFTLLPNFTPRPILCDNNLSALPDDYQDYIIRRYEKTNTPLQDANSGFEPKQFDFKTYERWKKILRGPWRFAFDETKEWYEVGVMMDILKAENQRKKQVYVLIGNEPFEDCYRRVRQVIEWGGEPYCQPLLALNALSRRPMIRFDWTEQKLIDFARWTTGHFWKYAKRFEDYDPSYRRIAEAQMQMVMPL